MKNIKKIIEYGLYLLVFLLPLQTRWIIKAGELNGGYWEYGTYSLYLTDVFLIMVLFLYIIWRIKYEKSQIPNPKSQIPIYWWLIAGLELFVFISIFVAPDKWLALFGYGRFLLGLGLFWLIVNANYDRMKLIYWFLAGVVLQAGLGMWQFLTQSSFSSKWLGMAKHDPGTLGTSVVETLAGDPSTFPSILLGAGLGAGRWLRAYGGLDHPNMLGGLLVVGIILTIGIIISNSKSQVPNSKQTPNLKFQIPNHKLLLLFIAICLLSAALIFTFSRGAWLGLIAGIVAIITITLRQKKNYKFKLLFKIMTVMGVLSVLLIGLYSDLILTRLSQATRLEVKSNTERIESYSVAKEIIKKHLLLGVGINNYTLAQFIEIDNTQPSWYYQPVHNTFLLIWAEIGLMGLFFFLSILLFTVYLSTQAGCLLFTKRFLDKNTLKYNYLALIAVVIILFIIDHYLWSMHFGIVLFWLVMGLVYEPCKSKKAVK